MSKNVLMQLAERFAVLSPAQQKKFYAKVQEQGQSYEQFPIVPVTQPDPEGRPVSYAQQRQWFLWALDRESSAYHLSSALQLEGQLNREALRQSFDYLVQRHTQLRTVFSRAEDGQIKQRVLAVESLAIREQDVRGLPAQDRAERLQTTLRDWQLQPFDLEQGPLLRIGLIRREENTHILLVVVHHIVADDGSLQLLVQEWAQAYQAFIQGQAPLLEPLPVDYADYAQWQRHWMQAGEQQRQSDYWVERLGGHQPVLQLPTDGSRRQDGRYAVASQQVVFTSSQMLALRSVCAQGQMSLFMALLAAFELLLYRYTAQEDIRVGIPVSNRSRPETEGLVGFFANTQVMQNRLHDRLSLRELLTLTRTAVMQAQEHQDLPFEQLVQALHPERALGVNPLFQVMFNHLVQGKGQEGELLAGLSLQDYPLASQQAQFELVFNTHETQDGGLVLACSYAKELFLPSTISRLCEHYQHILAALVETPDCLIGNLALVFGEQGRELERWGHGREQHGVSRPVHEQLSVHAQTRPDAAALIFEGRTLSYGQLEAQANRLAHALMARGVRPEDRVGIAVSRSLDMVVGMMAVLKAGAAYVPLDLDYPADRLQHMAQDSGMALLLSHSDVDTSAWRPSRVSLVLLDRLDTSAYPADCPAVTVHEEQLAYLIYTSGSTGLPKGVAVRHRGLSLCMAWMQHAYALGADDTVLHKAPFSFDVSCWEIFWPLSQGVRLVIASPGDHRDPQRIFELIERYQITTVNFVPAMLQAFLSHCGDRVPSLRHVMCGGEAISSAVQSLSVQRLGAGVLQNLYGPTETTIHVTRWTCVDDGRTPVPIGQPIDQTQAYVLDGALNLVPSGVEGELYIGGDLLARGYENRAELTAERFVADPFSEGGRLYRTGDLVRWNEEGQLEYLGRLDHQVKVRGFRIELGEVESQLLSLEGVREAVVVARSGPQGMQLVGYVSGDARGPTLRDQLSSQLPDYMVPSVIMVLEALPLNANGKIDRKALPEPEFVSGQTYEAPQGELETTLATIWSQVLGVEQVGRQDNFFELGGHSLLALTLIERLRAAGIVSQVRTLFQHPVLSAFASAQQQDTIVDIQVPANGIPADCTAITPQMLPLVSLNPAEIEALAQQVPGGMAQIQDIYPLAPLQQGMLFHHLLDGQGDAYVTPTLLSFDSRERLERFVDSLNQVIARHDILRTSVHWEGLSDPVQVVHRAAQVTVQWPELMESQNGQVQSCSSVSQDTTTLSNELASASSHSADGDGQHTAIRTQLETLGEQRMDVRQAPMLRLIATNDADSERYLLSVSLHHLISDHTTLERMIQEISLIQQNQHEALPAVVPFRNFVAQSVLGADEALHRAFFTEMLGQVEEPTAPFGVLDIQGDGSTVEEVSQPLPAELSHAIRELARSQAVSAASVFHLAWALVLSVSSGQSRPVFGTVLFGRMQGGQGIDQAMGMFINTLPVCIDLEQQSVAQALQQTHQRLTALLSHEHASLSLAQQCSGVPAGAPLFTSMLNYRYMADATQDSQGGAWEGMQVLGGQERSNYPITVSINDDGGLFSVDMQVAIPARVHRLLASLQTALQQLLALLSESASSPVRGIQMLGEQEQALLSRWGTHHTPGLSPVPVHHLFEQQVARDGQRIAVENGAASITYAQLNAQANQLAHYLLAQGVSVEDKIGVALDRSLTQIVALLAIAKAGAAFVPLDLAYPSERLQYMAQDSGLCSLLTESGVARPAWLAESVPVLALDALSLSAYPSGNPSVAVQAGHLAYVMYTSGSTGQPKGVETVHQGVYRLVYQPNFMRLDSSTRMLQFAPITFDASTLEIWGTLCNGGTLVQAPAGLLDYAQLGQVIEGSGVNTAWLTAALFNRMLEDAPHALSRLTQLLSGGEAMSLVHAQRAVSQLTQTQLINGYGPTESTTFAVCARVEHSALQGTQVPLGVPINETSCWVLDADLQRVPEGVAGELYLGGLGLARGYQNRADLTADRFVADPFSSNGARLYRTGDRVRWTATGQLEYLGRQDHQVKVRGFRIELGEVESQLQSLSGVREAVVVAHTGSQGAQLVAYVSGEGALSGVGLREQLSAHVPDYMVPSVVMVLDALPLNANGKIDRRSLPEPEFVSGQEYEAPQGEQEVALASIWSQVLGVERVGRHDNFFELGGHSLMALTLVGEISKQNLGIPGDLAMLLRTQTVAAYIAEQDAEHRTIALNQSLEKSPPLFMIHDGRGSILDYFHLGQALAPSCPVVGLPIDSDRVPDSLQTLARMHAQTIQAYQPSGSLKMAGWSLGGALALQIAAILEAQGRDVAWVGAIDPYTQALDDLGFDFSQFVHQYVLAIVDPEQHESLLSDPFVSTCLKNLAPSQADLTQMTVYVRAQYPVNHQSGLAQLNDQELAELCMTSWLLYQARKVHCPAVQVQASVHTWWAGDGANAEHFSQWMGSSQCTEVVLPQDDHGSIVRSPRLLADLQALCRAA